MTAETAPHTAADDGRALAAAEQALALEIAGLEALLGRLKATGALVRSHSMIALSSPKDDGAPSPFPDMPLSDLPPEVTP